MVADNPAGLIATACVQSQGRSYLFYSRPNGNLAYLKSETEREAGTSVKTPLYKPYNIMVDGNVISANTNSPQITAVAYNMHGSNEIRLYYISGDGELQELCQSNGGSWTAGSLNNAEISASPKSLLAASVDYTMHGELKLYYNRENNSMMYCAWVSLNEQSWSIRKINEKY